MQGQGIQSLAPMGGPQQKPMGGMPQQKPMGGMPQAPMGGSMGGLGSVEDRVAAFRGRPEQLQQKYAMSQDLLDLLALQKIKSEKESAARQMQLAMNQQAMQNGQMPTVAQQREQEVHQLTKNELAQQRAATDQQKQQEEQDAIQQLASSGIATAPGANTVGMAQGGIIGFNGTDKENGSQVPVDPFGMPIYEDDYERPGWFNWKKGLEADPLKKNPELKAALEREIARRNGANVDKPTADAPPTGKPPADVTGAKVPDGYGDMTQVGQPPASAPPAQQGIPSASVGIPSMKMPTAPNRQNDGGLQDIISKLKSQDPEAAAKSRQAEVSGLLGLTPEQKAVYEKNIAEREKAYNEQFDPEKMKWDSIGALLRGAGGRRWNVLGAAGDAMAEHDKGVMEAKNKARSELHTAREKYIDSQRAHLADAVKAGDSRYSAATTAQGQTLKAATDMYDANLRADSSVYSSAMHVYAANLQAKVQAASNALTADYHNRALAQNDINSWRQVSAEVQTKFESIRAQEDKLAYAVYKDAIAMIPTGGKITPEQQTQKNRADQVLQDTLAINQKVAQDGVARVLSSLRPQSSTGGPRIISVTPPQKAP